MMAQLQVWRLFGVAAKYSDHRVLAFRIFSWSEGFPAQTWLPEFEIRRVRCHRVPQPHAPSHPLHFIEATG